MKILMLPTHPALRQAADFNDLPRWLWLWLPIVYVLVQYAATFNPDFYKAYFHSETGVTELGTLAALFPAIIAGLLVAQLALRLGDRLLAAFGLLMALGCVYFFGEEASWGQHVFGWDTPDTWAEFNDQSETNLHNLAGPYGFLFDQLPRGLLTLAALVGGVIMPLWRHFKQRPLDPARWAYWYWPTMVCLPSCLLALTIKIPKDIWRSMDYRFDYFNVSGENKEFFLAMFLMIYLMSLYTRLRQLDRARR